MDGGMGSLVKVSVTAALSGCYCYALSKYTQKGILRLLLLLPVAAAFSAAPYSLLFSCHISGTTWFFLTWLGISKLLLFSFGAGPLAAREISLPRFVCTLLLPIKIQRPGPKDSGSDPGNDPTGSGTRFWRRALFGAKVLAFGCVIEAYNYREGMSFWVLLVLYCFHVYLALEILLVISGALARGSLGLELAPQADEPYLSSSLQDFWGRRWNLMVSDALRQTVHNPIRSIATPLIGKKPSILVGVLASFLVSGVMHEWVFAILTRASPTWEVTCFFLLHGACLVVELLIKMAAGNKWRLHRAVSGSLTVGFVIVTAAWLFFPPLLRSNTPERVIEEYAILGRFLKRNVLCLFRHQQTPQ
ncbi:hypothetical protein V2J09_011619 [Rumex salicifolius]